MSFTITVHGLSEAAAQLEPATWQAGVKRGLLRVGQLAADAVKLDIAPHHYTGRAQQQVHAQEIALPGVLAVHVGASSELVPELRPLVEGWKSSGGRQPPTAAIAEWLAHKPEIAPTSSVSRSASGRLSFRASIASVSSETAVRSRAFLIARAIGRRGYSFGKTDSFRKAWEKVGPTADQIIREEMQHHV